MAALRTEYYTPDNDPSILEENLSMYTANV